MADVSLRLLVLRTGQLDRLRAFYDAFGVEFVQERHGDGPVHDAGQLGDAILEIYLLASETGLPDTSTRLGFAVSGSDTVTHDGPIIPSSWPASRSSPGPDRPWPPAAFASRNLWPRFLIEPVGVTGKPFRLVPLCQLFHR